MNKFLILTVTLILLLNNNLLSQEINADLLDNLTKDQIEDAQKLLDNKKIITREGIKRTQSNNSETLIKKELSNSVSLKFGYDFISSSPTSIVATGDLPLPNDYKISLGDTVGIILSGSKEGIFDLKVSLDGTIFFPSIGSISVAGETFGEVKKKLNNIVNQTYIGVDVDISLIELSAKKITIVGAVNNPGTYLVNPFTTISNSLAYSGGIQQIGSLRNIKLLRSNQEYISFDLYDLLIDGDRNNDITIESGDVIIVGTAYKFIDISGEVKRPGSYEILPEENLRDLLRYALGAKGGANISKITLNMLDNKTASIKKVITDNLDHSLNMVTSVNIYPYLIDYKPSVFIDGAIKEPGFYEIENYKNLEELINNIEFVNVYPWLAVLEQFDENNLVKSSILFNLKDINTYKEIELLPNSKLFFANIDSRDFNVNSISKKLISDYSLRIRHKQSSYELPVFGNFKLSSFVDFLGLDMTDVNLDATYISPLDDIVLIDDYRNMTFTAKKYNTVTFRSPVNNLISVSITGAVDYPGVYQLQPNSTLQDLYEVIGNFRKEAFLDGIILTRASIRDRQLKAIEKSKSDLNKVLLSRIQKNENVGDVTLIKSLAESIEPENLGRIAGNFSPNTKASISTVLLDGDAIVIPTNPYVVSVLGEVLNPIAFEYSNRLDIRSAIQNAGGLNKTADKSRIYIIKSNGLIVKANRSIFTRNIDLEPGDSIVVPRRIYTNNPGIDALIPITTVLSDLAFSAAALESLKN